MRVDWSSIVIEMIVARHFDSPTDQLLLPRVVYDHLLWWLAEGQLTVLRNGRARTLKSGDLYWFRPGADYQLRRSSRMPVRLYTIRFDMLDARSKQRIAAMPLPPERVSGLDQELTHSVFTRLAVAAEGEPSGGAAFRGASRHQSVCLLTALLIEIDRLTAKRPGEPPVLVDDRLGRIQELALRISRTLAWRMSVADMAREAGLSPSHFAVSFRKATTKSPRQFIVNWRIRHAAQMLAETELPIKAIAAQVGCEDVGFFSRQFRARAGFAPRAFRNRSSARRQ